MYVPIIGGPVGNHRRTKRHQLSKREINKVLCIGYPLKDLFFEEELEDLVIVARHRVSREFHFATEQNPRWTPENGKKKFIPTDNYIVGVSDRPSELARHVLRNMRHAFIRKHQLPSHLRSTLPDWLIEEIISKAQYDLLLNEINAMRQDGDIWYHWGLGIWQSRQSNLDKLWEYIERQYGSKSTQKFDDRSWHGRPRRDRGTMPEGAAARFA